MSGMGTSLAVLRHELEGMQLQDKALYAQLLTLQDSIRSLRSELKKEREEYDEVFLTDEQISEQQSKLLENREKQVFMDGERSDEDSRDLAENDKELQHTEWKHDRQDSGISVRTPEGETTQDFITSVSNGYVAKYIPDPEPSLQSYAAYIPKPTAIKQDKDNSDVCSKTGDFETTQKAPSTAKPSIIHHNKEDSGILIDEEAVRETKLLSRLVQSSSLFEKIENRKTGGNVQNRWQRVRETIPTTKNRVFERSVSSSNIFSSQAHQMDSEHRISRTTLVPGHKHTNSCPQALFTHSTTQEKRLQSPEKPNNVHHGQENTKNVTLNSCHEVKPVLKTGFTPKHAHTQSLPTTTTGELMANQTLHQNRNGFSMQNISRCKVVPSHQTRPHQRSASVVDIGSLEKAQKHSTRVNNNTDSKAQRKSVNEAVSGGQLLRAVLVSANEVTISNINQHRPMSRQYSLDQRTSEPGNYYRPSNLSGVQRRFPMTDFKGIAKPQSLRSGLDTENGQFSPRLSSPNFAILNSNHVGHHNIPDYDARRRHYSLYATHVPSKSWDGNMGKPKEMRSMMRSASYVSLV